MESRPTTAFILTLLGGLFLLLGTVMGVVFAPAVVYPYATSVPDYYYPFLLASAVAGGLVLAAAWALYTKPEQHVAWGIVTIVLSVIGAVGLVTGYFALFGAAGVVFGLVGGSMAVAWKTAGWASQPALGTVRMCSGCGRYVPVVYPYCAFCGTPAPTFHPPAGSGVPPPAMPPRM